MPLSCICDADGEWWYLPPDDFSLLVARRGRRCVSCGGWIRPGETVVRFECERATRDAIEERIYGDTVAMAPRFMCDSCGGLYFSLTDLGFCVRIGDSMRELVAEYAQLYGHRKTA